MGYRHRHHALKIGSFGGECLAWNDKIVSFICSEKKASTCDLGERKLYIALKESIVPVSWSAGLYKEIKRKDFLWNKSLAENEVAHSIVLCSNRILTGGTAVDKDNEATGFIRSYKIDDGEEGAKIILPSPLCYNSLVVDNNRIYVTLENGSVVCLGVK